MATLYLPSQRKYIEDYTDADWKSSTYAAKVTPRTVRADFTSIDAANPNSITNLIPNMFTCTTDGDTNNCQVANYSSSQATNTFLPSSPPLCQEDSSEPTTHIPRAFLVAGIKREKKEDITIFVLVPSETSGYYYGTSNTVCKFWSPDNLGMADLEPYLTYSYGPLFDGRVKLNSNKYAWILRRGTSFSSIRNLTKYKTITWTSSYGNVVYDVYELTSYSRDRAPSNEYEILYQYPTNDGKNYTSYANGSRYRAKDWVKATMKLVSPGSFDWGSGTPHLSSFPTAPFNVDDRKMGIKFSTGSSYSTPSTDKIYQMPNYSLYSYISEYNLPTAIKTTAKCGNSSKKANMGSTSTLATGTGEQYGSIRWPISNYYEQFILPANALSGPLTFIVNYSVTTPVWNKRTTVDGVVQYDVDNYNIDKEYTYTFAVDLNHIPSLVVATGTRFRNHTAKYAILANNYDYFDYNWRGSVTYAADPTVTLTLVYGDQIQLTKTMDGTSSATQTFQHGPFLGIPVGVEGQLMQAEAYVTDARGRQSATKIIPITDNNSQSSLEYMRFYAYTYPTAQVQAYRCLADGTPDDENGTYVKLTATYAFSQLDHGLTNYSEGTTDGKLVIRAKPHSGTLSQDTWNEVLTTANGQKTVMLSVGLDQSLDLQVTVTDFIGNTFSASTEFIPSSQVVLDFRAGGEGLAIGKRNEFNKALEVEWDTTFYGNVNIRGNVNISGATQTATTADAVSYYDTHSIGARTVQAAIDELANRAGVSTQQVQAIVNQAISNLDVPTDDHINELIVAKINNIVFPPSISEARALELITNALSNYYTKQEVDNKIATVDLSGYYTKQEVDEKIAAIPSTDLSAYSTTEQVQAMINQAISAIINVNEVRF